MFFGSDGKSILLVFNLIGGRENEKSAEGKRVGNPRLDPFIQRWKAIRRGSLTLGFTQGCDVVRGQRCRTLSTRFPIVFFRV